MPVYAFSQTAAANASADPTQNWAEGQAPSSLNDSARALLAAIAQWRDDLSGSITSTGISTAFVVTSNSGYTAASQLNGKAIAFTPNVTSGAAPTLIVDGIGPFPIQSAPNVNLPAGTLVQGTPYVVLFNSTASAFFLQSFFGPSPFLVPVGSMLPFLGTTAPNSNFVLPFGQAISRTTYASLYAIAGTSFGAGDGVTTFNVPDLRGRSLFGLDTMGGTASGRLTSAASGVDGTTIGANGGVQNVTVSRASLPNTNIAVTITDNGHTHTMPSGLIVEGGGSDIYGGGGYGTPNYSATGNSTTGISAAFNLNGNVTQTALETVPPAIVVPWILRII